MVGGVVPERLCGGCTQPWWVMVHSNHGSAPKLTVLAGIASERPEGWPARCWKLSGGLY